MLFSIQNQIKLFFLFFFITSSTICQNINNKSIGSGIYFGFLDIDSKVLRHKIAILNEK